ncbi:MAG: polysaccharide biosynthesis/export family protein [Polaribacter sp.]|nr:polysaccharide biosynthesis/export family protein [Polaribacter sp.]
MKKYFLLLLSIAFLSSCVPSKNLIYLQGEAIQEKGIKRINNIPYKLQVDDVLNIDIKSSDQKMVAIFVKQSGENSSQNIGPESSYFSGYSIDSYGNIRMPTLGEINVLGYTTEEVRKKIENELNKYFKNKDDIFVSVKLAGIKYTIIGEINNPGPKVIFQNKVSIIDAISNSGNITIVGDRKRVEIIRNSISGIQKFTIDLTDISAFNSDVFYIKPNDIINIIPLKQKTWGTGTTGLQTFTTVISVITLLYSTVILAKNL